jgi:hypothetical protein
MKLSNDPNAITAFNAVCSDVYAIDMKEYRDNCNIGFPAPNFDSLSDSDKKEFENHVKIERIKHFMEQSEAKVCEQNGTFVCESGYAFKTKVEECENYRIYRCDGGNHYAVVYIEHKERGGSQGNEIKYIIKNGQLVPELDSKRNNDQLELE